VSKCVTTTSVGLGVAMISITRKTDRQTNAVIATTGCLLLASFPLYWRFKMSESFQLFSPIYIYIIYYERALI
jgi:hypothetical protein